VLTTSSFAKTILKLALLLVTFSMAACAVGNKYDLATSAPDMSKKIDTSAAVGVHDQRSFILDDDKEPQFIGLQRGGFGNPFDVTTKSGAPLAKDIEDSVVQGLEKAGIKTSRVVFTHTQTPGQVKDVILGVGADHSLLIIVNKWKSDTYTNTQLTYDLSAFIYGKDGKLLAENRIVGSNDLGGDAWNPPAHAEKAVPTALSDKLDQLLDTPEILDALSK